MSMECLSRTDSTGVRVSKALPSPLRDLRLRLRLRLSSGVVDSITRISINITTMATMATTPHRFSASTSAFVSPVSLLARCRPSSITSASSTPATSRPLSFSSSFSSPRHALLHRPFSSSSSSTLRMSIPPSTTALPAAVTVTSAPPLQKPPPAVFSAAVTLGAAKARLPALKIFLLGILGGAYIALGGFLALRVGSSLPALASANPGIQRLLFGLFGLPSGLLMVLTTGAELFTGNTMLLSAACFARAAPFSGLLKNWIFSFLGNFVGSLLVVKLVILSGLLPSVGVAVSGMAVMKTSLPFAQLFFRGVVCNWLVCLAVYMANGASDMSGKLIAATVPVSMFVSLGMEHSVANMFLIPLGMKAGADVTTKALLMGNLLPVTLGNIAAGVVLVSLAYFLAYGTQNT